MRCNYKRMKTSIVPDPRSKDNTQSFEVKPVSKSEVVALKQFKRYTPEQRAELITIGFETLARKYQRNADKVSG